MGREPVAVDILTEIPGVGFDAAWERGVVDTVDSAAGLKATFISRDDLIAAKLAARSQDLADVAAMQKARQSAGSPGARETLAETKPGGAGN